MLAALSLAAGPASAHGSSKSLGVFFSGVIHPLLEPAHLVALVALCLLLGQRGMEAAKPALLAFGAALLLGVMAAGFGWRPQPEPLLLACAAAAGVGAAAALPRLPSVVGIGLGVLVGAGIGLSSVGDGMSGGAMWGGLLGTALGGITWLVNGVMLVGTVRKPWTAILVRVAGSWAAACAVLVLALWLAGKQAPIVRSAPGPADRALDLRR